MRAASNSSAEFRAWVFVVLRTQSMTRSTRMTARSRLGGVVWPYKKLASASHANHHKTHHEMLRNLCHLAEAECLQIAHIR